MSPSRLVLTLGTAALLSVLCPINAMARTVEPGKLIASGHLGPAFLNDSRLGGSDRFLLLGAGLEYPFTKSISAAGDVSFGLSGSQQLKLRGGGRYRWANLDLPISPYAEGHAVVGRLFDVIGTDLSFYGIRAGAGADYFLTAKLLVGAKLGYEIARTTGANPTTFAQVELLATVGMVL
ncbi:MAG: hypothetical protein AAF654_02875 [Myxococcota bacterium]